MDHLENTITDFLITPPVNSIRLSVNLIRILTDYIKYDGRMDYIQVDLDYYSRLSTKPINSICIFGYKYETH